MIEVDMEKKLPEGWQIVKLGDLSYPSKGSFRIGPFGSSLTKDELSSKGIPVVGIENVLINKFVPTYRRFISPEKYEQLSDYKIEYGDILVSTMGTIGRSAVVPQNAGIAIIDSHLFRMRLDLLKADPYYVCFTINGNLDLRRQLEKKSSGSIMAGLNTKILKECVIPLPSLPEQKRIAAILTEKMAAVEKAKAAAEARLKAAKELPAAYLRESYEKGGRKSLKLNECLVQTSKGVGPTWSKYPVMGATRSGLAPAKEGVGKSPERYKLVDEGTVFYNPMRILLGSIALIDDGDQPGITSPDYVALKGKDGVVNSRWFYYWMRSPYGESFIKSMSRGAVRERMLFNRLAEGEVEFPSWQAQQEAAEKMKYVRPTQLLIEEEIKAIESMPALLLRQVFAGEI